ncbi:MAG: transcription antitermination factor NusB [Pseudomonadota bacterium]
MSPRSEEKRLKRSAARLAAVQALFQMERSGGDWRDIREEFETHRLGMTVEGDAYREADVDLFRALLEGAVNRQARTDQSVNAAMKDGWPIARIDPVLRALFRAAGAELFDRDDTPPKVVISEYVDVAKAFFPEGKEPGLVNAVLDKLAREARPGAFA